LWIGLSGRANPDRGGQYNLEKTNKTYEEKRNLKIGKENKGLK